jgi:hypothetical protein
VEEFIRDDSGGQSMMRTNQAALVLGFLSALGMSMVANFQVSHVPYSQTKLYERFLLPLHLPSFNLPFDLFLPFDSPLSRAESHLTSFHRPIFILPYLLSFGLELCYFLSVYIKR